MKLERIAKREAEEAFLCSPQDFGEPVPVQGGKKRALGNKLFIESGGRYKLFGEGCDLILFTEGSGHFKWARGETSFTAGDVFRAEKLGEYEINGLCSFFVVRE